MKKTYFTATLLLLTLTTFAQQKVLSLSEAIDIALQNNPTVRAAHHDAAAQRQLSKISVDLPKTDVMLMYGQYNSFSKNDNNLSLTQSIPFTVFGAQASANRAMSTSIDYQKSMTENEIIWQVKRTYHQLLYARAFHLLLQREDSLYGNFVNAASTRYRTGESRLLEKLTADEQLNEIAIRMRQNEVEMLNLKSQLEILLNVKDLPPIGDELVERSLEAGDTSAYLANPSFSYAKSQVDLAERDRRLQQARFAPDLQVGVFTQTLIGTVNPDNGNTASANERFTGFQVGLSMPIWFGPHRARVKAAEFSKLAAESRFTQFTETLRAQANETLRQVELQKANLGYYEKTALPNAEKILSQSQTAFQEGEIDYPEFLLALRNSISVKENYLKALNDYNQNVIYLEYLTGQK
jgi:heavy metal efflux system protein